MSEIAVRHLGEDDERCLTLCGADLPIEDRYTNVPLDTVTWGEDDAWISGVTCPACLELAVKIGEDARRRLVAVAPPSDPGPGDDPADRRPR